LQLAPTIGAARVGDVGEAEQRRVGGDLGAEAEDVEGRDARLAGEASREGGVHRRREEGRQVGGTAAMTAGARPTFGASQTMMCCAPAACSESTIEPTLAANECAVARIVAGMLAPPPIAVRRRARRCRRRR
jgi:hypothetical protein